MQDHYNKSKGLHLNYKVISQIIENGSKVLDLGCGGGDLLEILQTNNNVVGKGIEIEESKVIECIEKGLSVFQGNIDEGLKEFPSNSYDYVILNQTLQMTHKPEYIIQEMLRVGTKGVISFPNFAYHRVRLYLLLNGRMPKSNMLPFEWYNTPNIHLLTINDFREFCIQKKIKITKEVFMTRAMVKDDYIYTTFANLLSEEAIFVIQS